jgi:nitrate/nitrite transporter NarK
MVSQLALLVDVPFSSHVLFAVIASAGATPVLSFAIVGRYFPKEVAGRANAALGVLNMGTAFGLQCLSGLIIAQWPADGGHYPAQAHQVALAVGLGLQLVGLAIFLAPKRRLQPMPMGVAVARTLGVHPSIAATLPAPYAAALSAWRKHIVHTRRQATAWRFTAVASMALCAGLGGALSLALVRPAVAFHLVEGSPATRASADVTSTPFEGATPAADAAAALPRWLWQRAAAHD